MSLAVTLLYSFVLFTATLQDSPNHVVFGPDSDASVFGTSVQWLTDQTEGFLDHVMDVLSALMRFFMNAFNLEEEQQPSEPESAEFESSVTEKTDSDNRLQFPVILVEETVETVERIPQKPDFEQIAQKVKSVITQIPLVGGIIGGFSLHTTLALLASILPHTEPFYDCHQSWFN